MYTQNKWPKPIIITTRFGPNYLWHILATAKIGYDSEYADDFQNTINPDDMRYLESIKQHLEFEAGQGGALSGLYTVMPAFLPLESKIDFEKYFASLDKAFQEGSLVTIANDFPEADWSDRFMREFLGQPEFPQELLDLRDVARRLGEIYLRNLDSYRENVWGKIHPTLAERAAKINAFFTEEDYIAKWEKFLGIPFASNRYEIVLCYANKNGPDYNSLGYSGNLFYYDKPFKRTCQFLSHEIATHLLIDIYFNLAKTGKYEHARLYAAYESLAKFYN